MRVCMNSMKQLRLWYISVRRTSALSRLPWRIMRTAMLSLIMFSVWGSLRFPSRLYFLAMMSLSFLRLLIADCWHRFAMYSHTHRLGS